MTAGVKLFQSSNFFNKNNFSGLSTSLLQLGLQKVISYSTESFQLQKKKCCSIQVVPRDFRQNKPQDLVHIHIAQKVTSFLEETQI